MPIQLSESTNSTRSRGLLSNTSFDSIINKNGENVNIFFEKLHFESKKATDIRRGVRRNDTDLSDGISATITL